jgi:hypothetical protein
MPVCGPAHAVELGSRRGGLDDLCSTLQPRGYRRAAVHADVGNFVWLVRVRVRFMQFMWLVYGIV